MTGQNKMQDRKSNASNSFQSIFFNLVAIAVLLATIFFLHQMLKKPKQPDTVNAIAPIPSAAPEPAPVEAEKPAATVVDIAPEAPAAIPAKEPEALPVAPNVEKTKQAKKAKIYRSMYETSETELDSHEARVRYIEENKRMSSGATAPSAPTTTPVTVHPSPTSDLDDETTRQQYLEENRHRSSAAVAPRKDAPMPAPKTYATTLNTYAPAAKSKTYASKSDLDDETARRHYLEQNRRLSGQQSPRSKK